MGAIGTFGSFTIARLGIYASQSGLNTTGNNITNINSKGYSRQNIVQTALRTGGADRYAANYSTGSGNGVLVTGVDQTRDLYLDIRYRSEVSSVGATDTWLSGLDDIAAILDEVGDGDGDGVIEAQFSDFINTLQNLSVYTGQDEFDTQVRSSAESLVTLFRNYATQLETVKINTAKEMDEDIVRVNEILESIQRLNSSIRKSEIHGDNNLEQRDERNLLIDELAEYMDIDVVRSYEKIGEGQEVERITIKLGNANPDPKVHSDETVLIDGQYGRRFEVSDDGNYNITLSGLKDTTGRSKYTTEIETNVVSGPGPFIDSSTTNPDTGVVTTISYTALAGGTYEETTMVQTPDGEVPLDDNDLYGALQSMRELLTECGEFASDNTIGNIDEDAGTKRGIPFYQKALDLLANTFATAFNKANNGNHDNAGNLFSNSGDGDETDPPITASNISIAAKWTSGEVKVVNSFTSDGSTANDNILYMITLMDQDHLFNPKNVEPDAASGKLFTGSFQEMLSNISSTLGNDMRSTGTMLESYSAAASELDASRANVSSVDLNDEAANLMMYQNSYSAACRLMTTLDEVLQTLINGTAR